MLSQCDISDLSPVTAPVHGLHCIVACLEEGPQGLEPADNSHQSAVVIPVSLL